MPGELIPKLRSHLPGPGLHLGIDSTPIKSDIPFHSANKPIAPVMAMSNNKQKMIRGELYHAFTPELVRERASCRQACDRYNSASEVSRRRMVEFWRAINGDERPMPAQVSDTDEDDALFDNDPWVESPIRVDYGTNVRLGDNVYVNSSCTFIDTCLITIGARTLVGPNVSFYSGTHPIDPELRNGTKGPELGAEIHVGGDCWFGGNVTVLPGVTIGRGSTIGAGSVVTKDVPAYHVVAGNPARIIRKIETKASGEQ